MYCLNKYILLAILLHLVSGNSIGQIYYDKIYNFNNIEGFGYGRAIRDTSIYINGFNLMPDNSRRYTLTSLDIKTGDTIWYKQWGNPTENYYLGYGNTVQIYNSKIYSTGFHEDTSSIKKPFLLKHSLSGDTLWRKFINCTCSFARFDAMQITKDGNFIFAGLKRISPTNDNLYLVKTDTNGTVIWEQNYGGANQELAYSVDTTTDGGFILAGYTNSYGMGGFDAYIVKTDSAGNFQWHKWYGNVDSDIGYIKSQNDGTYILYGGMTNSLGTIKYSYIYKLDGSGNPIWQKQLLFPADNTGSANFVTDVTFDSNSNIVAVGSYASSIISDNPIGFIYKISQLGDSLLFKNYYVRPNDNYLNSIIPTNDGGFIMAGFVFPDGSGNTQDGWVLRVDSTGCESISCVLNVKDINQINNNSMLVYPNPASDLITIEFESLNNVSITIINIYGEPVFRKENYASGSSVSLNEFNNGIYLILLKDKEKVVGQKKIIITK